MSFLLGLVIGLIVGWNFMEQPTWVKNLVNNIYNKIVEKLSKK